MSYNEIANIISVSTFLKSAILSTELKIALENDTTVYF